MSLKERARQLKKDIPAIFLPLLVAATVKLIPQEVFERCRAESENMWSTGKPKKWYYAIPIVLVWILVIGCVVRLVLRKLC